MARSRYFWPLSIVVIGLVFTVWLALSTPPGTSLAQPSCDEQPLYPGCYEPLVDCTYVGPNECSQTQTAIAQNRTATVGALLTRTAQGQSNQQAATATPTSTFTATTAATTPTTGATSTATSTPTGITAAPTVPALPTQTPSTVLPTATFTATPMSQEMLRCAPGDLIELTGTARPQTALLVLFDERPVGGGASDRTGAFRIVLRIGTERTGEHEIIVRERERELIVAEYMCITPPPPTPTATFGPIRVTLSPVP